MSPEQRQRELDDAVKRWDETSAARTENPIQGWMDSPLVWETHVLPKIGGGPGRHWLQALVERHRIPRTGRWLSLGCGAACTEIAASRWELFGSMLALDGSSVSLEIARRTAAEQGVTNIEFGTADLNRLRLPAGAFDLVLMNMSLHHVKELRRTLTQVRKSLGPNGLLVANEFIGPRQFQFTDLQLGLVRELLALLPDRYRRDSTTGKIKTEYIRVPVEHWNTADPPEAVRSDRILPEIERLFRIVERVDYGGTILHLLLEHIVQNFDGADEAGIAILARLRGTEDILIRSGAIPSDFVCVVARHGLRSSSDAAVPSGRSPFSVSPDRARVEGGAPRISYAACSIGTRTRIRRPALRLRQRPAS
ncbi:MAG: class I SAM-dependent methyltransferase [Thermoanaerobaculia bacterium]